MLAKLETDASGAMVPLLCQLYRGRSSWRRWRSPDQLASIKPVSPQERGDHKEASDAADSHCHSGTRAAACVFVLDGPCRQLNCLHSFTSSVFISKLREANRFVSTLLPRGQRRSTSLNAVFAGQILCSSLLLLTMVSSL